MVRLAGAVVVLLLTSISPPAGAVTCPPGEFGIGGTLTLPDAGSTSFVDCVFFDGVGAEIVEPDAFTTLYGVSGAYDYGCHALSDAAAIPPTAATVICHTPDASAPAGDLVSPSFPVAEGYLVIDLTVGSLSTTTTTPDSTTTTTTLDGSSTTSTTGVATTSTTTTLPPSCGGSCDDADPCTADACDAITNTCANAQLTGVPRVVCPCERQPPAACAGTFLPRKVSKPEFAACQKLRTISADFTPRRVRKLTRVVRARTKVASRAAQAAGRSGQLSSECAAAVSAWMTEIGGASGLLTPQ